MDVAVSKTKRIMKIINDLEQFKAELLMEGEDCLITESMQNALTELYWIYKEYAVYDVEE